MGGNIPGFIFLNTRNQVSTCETNVCVVFSDNLSNLFNARLMTISVIKNIEEFLFPNNPSCTNF